MRSPLSLQSVVMALEKFWADHGCLIWQPYYTQVGAGTMNPATFLRVLGPEPWHVAYVEPSVRPDDGRFGENPNRLQQHYQYQVILKPDPGNPQELYLQSLEALGINLREHDVRFVEDNWESPALGAWGLGWEVWLDGQEITQFTYFQQAGGLLCDPVSVEITYGLERILIALQNVSGFREIKWNDSITYGEVNLQAEQEHSRYYFEAADVERLRQMYSLFEAEATAALAAGLVLPAHDYLLKCSHTFNILDTRGAIGVTERAAFFGRMRRLAREVAEAYVAQRQRLEFPLLKSTDTPWPVCTEKSEAGRRKAEQKKAEAQSSKPEAAATLLLEIGTEELPPSDLEAALEQLRELAPKMLAEARLDAPNGARVFGTPRRLVVLVEDLPPRQPNAERVIKGPPAHRAFDEGGQPTAAAVGFAKKNGLPVEALQTQDNYVVAVVHDEGRAAGDVLRDRLPQMIAAIKFDKAMRWNGSGVAFSRPIRWLVAMLGADVIPFEYAGVSSGNVTRGLRPLGSPEIKIEAADQYLGAIRRGGVTLDPAERGRAIEESVKRAAAEAKGEALIDPELLSEVTHLVEKPTPLVGRFEDEYLTLPRDVLISVMKKHQRYFPIVETRHGASLSPHGASLLPYFVAVRNGDDKHLDVVREGNEHVIRARFADANYFVREDLKQPLAAYRPRLSGLTFQAKLGSMLDKTERIERLTGALAAMLELDGNEKRAALRAAHLCKADLATRMVVEMTSLQGVMGREYARRSGESEEVAAAIGEHYQPVPHTRLGLAVALADRLDSLAGLFGAGLIPTGAKDPFGLRRAAQGVVQPLIEHKIAFDLRLALRAAGAFQPIKLDHATYDQILEFVVGRLRVLLIDSGFRYDVVDAVLAERGHDPYPARQSVIELTAWVAKPDWPATLAAYSRCVRITRDQKQTFEVKPVDFAAAEEKELWEAYQSAPTSLETVSSVAGMLNAFTPLIPSITKFFDKVMVMDDDPRRRENRLGLLQKISAMAKGVADLSKLEGF